MDHSRGRRCLHRSGPKVLLHAGPLILSMQSIIAHCQPAAYNSCMAAVGKAVPVTVVMPTAPCASFPDRAAGGLHHGLDVLMTVLWHTEPFTLCPEIPSSLTAPHLDVLQMPRHQLRRRPARHLQRPSSKLLLLLPHPACLCLRLQMRRRLRCTRSHLQTRLSWTLPGPATLNLLAALTMMAQLLPPCQ